MRVLLALLTYRGTVLLLNGAVLLLSLAALFLRYANGRGPPLSELSLRQVVAPALLLSAFVLPFVALLFRPSNRALLGIMIAANALVIVVVSPYLYFAIKNGIGLGAFVLFAGIGYVVPVLNIANAWLRMLRLRKA